MYDFNTQQRLGPSPLAGPSQHAVDRPSSSSSSSHRRPRNNSLDPVPEDSSLGRKRSLRTQQAQYQKDQARAARRRSEVTSGSSLSLRRMSAENNELPRSSSANGFLSPPFKPSKLASPTPHRDLLEPPVPAQAPLARPGRALSEARVMLERERLRVERSKTGPDWVIDLDDMEVGMKEWTRSTKSRVVLMLGEPNTTALKPVLTSPDFLNTLILLAANPSAAPVKPPSTTSNKDSTRPASTSTGSDRLSRQFGPRGPPSPQSTTNQMPRSPLSQSSPTSFIDKDARKTDARELVTELGSACLPEVQFLPSLKESKTVGDVVKQAVDAALIWRKKRKALESAETPPLASLRDVSASSPGLGSRRGSSHSDQVASSSRSHSPMHSRRPSMELVDGKDKRSTLSRSFSSVLSMATVVNKDEVETASQEGLGSGSISEPKQRARALDAVVNFLPMEDRPDSFQGSLQNVLVTTTALLPFMPSAHRISPTDSIEEKKRRNSTYSLVSSVRTSSFSSNVFPTGIVDMPQTLIHVLPVGPSPALIKATEAYLKSLFPRPGPESLSMPVAPRAYVLGNRVLGQPMKRASDMSPISGLGLMLSGAISCHSHFDVMYLDDLRSCRFESDATQDGPDEERNADNHTPLTAFFDPYSIARGVTDVETRSVGSLETPSSSNIPVPEIQVDPRLDSPTTPPLDYDNETSASSGDNSTHNRSVEGFSSPDVVALSPSSASSTLPADGAKTLKKKQSWLGRLFKKGTTS